MSVIKKFEDINLELIKDSEHEFLISNNEAAIGFGVAHNTINHHKNDKPDELVEGKHWVFKIIDTLGGKQKAVFWTKRGIVRLGFILTSDRAKRFRDWAEDVILVTDIQQLSPAEYLIKQAQQLYELEQRGEITWGIVQEHEKKIIDIENRLLPVAVITEEQAANIKEAVSSIAYLLGGEGPPAFGIAWSAFKREFDIVAYKNLPITEYGNAMEWLQDWYSKLNKKNERSPSDKKDNRITDYI